MRHVILTIGPQWAGKSTFCKEVIERDPRIVLVSRDAILTELFGTVYLDHYAGGHEAALRKMWEEVAKHLERDSVTIILDCWNRSEEDRANIVGVLRSLAADYVEGWYFLTPVETCLAWSFERDPIPADGCEVFQKTERERREKYYRREHHHFHLGVGNEEHLFDRIKEINPLRREVAKTA